MNSPQMINVPSREVMIKEPWRITENKIRSFGRLQRGWRYGDGGPITPDVQDAAIDLYRYAVSRGLYSVDVVPGVRNQIQLVISNHNQSAEFTIMSTPLGHLSVEYYHEIDDCEVALENGLSLEEAHHRLEEFSDPQWKSSGSSTNATSYLYMDDLGVLHSSLPQATTEYQSSVAAVLRNRKGVSVNTSSYITPRLPMTLQSSGHFYPTSYRLGAD